jgi:hypothetical protein
MQGRVARGVTGQQQVIDYLQSQGYTIDQKNIAIAHSQRPDIILHIKEFSEPIQIEVKTRDRPQRHIQTIEMAVLGDKSNPELDKLVQVITNGKFNSFKQAIKFYRKKYINYNETSQKPKTLPGYPGNEGTAKSGTIPSELNSSDPQALSYIRELYVTNLKHFGNNYFALITGENDVKIYFTGLGKNFLKAPAFPMPKHVKIDSYGSADKLLGGYKFRVGPKIMLP